MVIEYVDECLELRDAVGPYAKNVVQVSEVEGGFEGAFCKGLSLPLAHVQVSV